MHWERIKVGAFEVNGVRASLELIPEEKEK